MDAKTAGIIAKFKQNHSLAEQIMQSGDGQQLMNMLTREDGGAALEALLQGTSLCKGRPELGRKLAELIYHDLARANGLG